jgi:hypothetical protein
MILAVLLSDGPVSVFLRLTSPTQDKIFMLISSNISLTMVYLASSGLTTLKN